MQSNKYRSNRFVLNKNPDKSRICNVYLNTPKEIDCYPLLKNDLKLLNYNLVLREQIPKNVAIFEPPDSDLVKKNILGLLRKFRIPLECNIIAKPSGLLERKVIEMQNMLKLLSKYNITHLATTPRTYNDFIHVSLLLEAELAKEYLSPLTINLECDDSFEYLREAATELFGSKLIAIIIHGSAVKKRDFEDIDALIIVSNIQYDDIVSLETYIKRFTNNNVRYDFHLQPKETLGLLNKTAIPLIKDPKIVIYKKDDNPLLPEITDEVNTITKINALAYYFGLIRITHLLTFECNPPRRETRFILDGYLNSIKFMGMRLQIDLKEALDYIETMNRNEMLISPKLALNNLVTLRLLLSEKFKELD